LQGLHSSALYLRAIDFRFIDQSLSQVIRQPAITKLPIPENGVTAHQSGLTKSRNRFKARSEIPQKRRLPTLFLNRGAAEQMRIDSLLSDGFEGAPSPPRPESSICRHLNQSGMTAITQQVALWMQM
jgi:hypothetical protein